METNRKLVELKSSILELPCFLYQTDEADLTLELNGLLGSTEMADLPIWASYDIFLVSIDTRKVIGKIGQLAVVVGIALAIVVISAPSGPKQIRYTPAQFEYYLQKNGWGNVTVEVRLKAASGYVLVNKPDSQLKTVLLQLLRSSYMKNIFAIAGIKIIAMLNSYFADVVTQTLQRSYSDELKEWQIPSNQLPFASMSFNTSIANNVQKSAEEAPFVTNRQLSAEPPWRNNPPNPMLVETKAWEKPSFLSQRTGYMDQFLEEARVYIESETAEKMLDSIQYRESSFAYFRMSLPENDASSISKVLHEFETLKKDFSAMETVILKNTDLSESEKKGLLDLQKNLINFHSLDLEY